MYDNEGTDTKREWIEVYNPGPSSTDLATYILFEQETNHSIIHFSGPSTLASNQYAIIASDAGTFSAEYGITTSLFDSVFSLSNTGELLQLKTDSTTVVDSVSYTPVEGANGTGLTLQRISGVWGAHPATPGSGPAQSSSPTPSTNSTPPPAQETKQSTHPKQSSSAGSSGGGSATAPVGPPVYTGTLSYPLVTYRGAETKFIPSIKRTQGESTTTLSKGVHYINFGDGKAETFTSSHDVIAHTYRHSGTYTVVYTFTTSTLPKKEDVRVMSTITVLNQPVSLASVTPDGDVVLKNETTHTLDLSGWHVVQLENMYTIPEMTFLAGSQELTLAHEITGFTHNAPTALLYSNYAPAGPVTQPHTPVVKTKKVYAKTSTPQPVIPVETVSFIEEPQELMASVAQTHTQQKRGGSLWIVVVLAVAGFGVSTYRLSTLHKQKEDTDEQSSTESYTVVTYDDF